MSTITWLHLSDLHFRADKLKTWDQDIVLSKLLDDVKERVASGLRPDLIMVSGDIAFSGKAEEYALARQFLQDLRKAIHLTEEQFKQHLLIVPGNHDVDRNAVNRNAKTLAESLNEREAVAEVLADDVSRRLLLRRLDGYARFVNDYLDASPPFDDEHYFYTRSFDLGRRVAVLGLNTAWLAYGDEQDHGKLVLSEQQVRQALKEAGEADLRIALLHHPFDWLRPFDQDDCPALLTKDCQFILHGHLHRTGIQSLKTPDAEAILLSAGASYETRRSHNACNWVQFDLESRQGTAYLRMYSDQRGGFWTKDVMTYRNVSDGEYTFRLPAQGRVRAEGKRERPVPPTLSAAETVQWKKTYLQRMRALCNALPLAALGGEEGADQDITLDRVYIDLSTTTAVPLTEEEKKERQPSRAMLGRDEDIRLLSALEAAAQSPRLALLGEPGAGKSTFARKLLGWLAAAHLAGTEPPPGLTSDLLPIQIVLRDLTPRLAALELDALPVDRQREALAFAVRDEILDNLNRCEVPAFAASMMDALRSGKCLLVLDGLDEVPHDLRVRMRQATTAVIGQYNVQRVILTCRVRSYVGEAVLPGFQAYTLAPFNEDQVRQFSRAWYNAQKDLGRVDAEQAKRKAQNLAEAALSPDLRELSANPMMLTTMAIIHQQEVGLPKERVRLYSRAVDVLLLRWQKRKTGEQGLAPSPQLTEFLRDDLCLRQVMERLAYEAHRAGQGQREAADLPRGAALTLLEAPKYLGDAGLTTEFLDYVDQRAGLLVGRGGEPGRPVTYSFPHRTFQEYLAGCYMAGQRDAAREFFARAGEGDYWSLAALLGAEELQYNRRNTNGLLDLAYRLCPATSPTDEKSKRALLWSGQMAALAGRDAVERDIESPDGGKAYLERLIPCLVDLLSSNLIPLERAEAGRTLAKLGDPREAVMLPEKMEFCFVPAGPFIMGTRAEDIPTLIEKFGGEQEWYAWETPQHQRDLPAFYIARYPVTNAQFNVFVEAGGYREPRYWREAQAAGWWDASTGCFKGRYDDEPRDKPYDFGEPFSLSNHPVVGVSWYEALAFTRWLSERLGKNVRLPSEAEWEKAARGGIQIPTSRIGVKALAGDNQPPKELALSLSKGSTPEGTPETLMVENPKRLFPWGDEPDPNRANYSDTGIGATSTVGCFPTGASPYGVLDLAGNVWEWCATKWQDSYQDYRNDNSLEGDSPRVLRGGAFSDDEWLVRCAYRYRYNPDHRFRLIGFRVVVVSPL